uniref:Protein phosphatase 1 regulatory subunit pprA-like n=1 Tax=Rhizophora mucronata TaxID=61149 RepID=A0A2P2KAX5_RHIMU
MDDDPKERRGSDAPEADDNQTVEMDPTSTVLDLTSFQLHHLDSVELSPSLTELDLTANRLSRLDPRIAHLLSLKKLSLRQNLIDDVAMEPFSHWNELSGLEVFQMSHS